MDLYELCFMYMEDNNKYEQLFEEIIKLLKPLIEGNMWKVLLNEPEDLRQELHYKIYTILKLKKLNLRFIKNKFDNVTELKFIVEADKVLLINYLAHNENNKLLYKNYLNSITDYNEFIKSINKFIGNIKILSYFKTVIRNYSLNYWKKQKKYIDGIVFDDEKVHRFQTKENKEIITLDELYKIKSLSILERKVAELMFFKIYNYTQREIAEILNVEQQYISKLKKDVVKKMIEYLSK